MLESVQLIALAVVQGLTEFLPVSSSGHLVLMQGWLGAHEGDLLLDVVLHAGTLGSVLLVYRREIARLARLDAPARGYVAALAVGTAPAVVAGLLLREPIAALFASPRAAAIGLLLTATVLLSTRRIRGDAPPLPGRWQPRPIPFGKALLVGTAQAFAIIPGVSRSGSTIAASLWLGLPRPEAARFSFLLSVPAIAGALVLELLAGTGTDETGIVGLVAAALVACGVGLLAIRWTALAVIQHHFWKFAFYCLGLGITVLVLLR